MAETSSVQTAPAAGSVRIGGSRTEPGFAREVERVGGQKLSTCFQCGKCVAGCPLAFAMDVMPNQITRMAMSGLADQALRSRTIWLCVGCQTCFTRCPRRVDLPRIMDALRVIASRRGVPCPEPDIRKFHQTFLAGIERCGRLHELALVAALKLKTGRLFKDLPVGAAMMAKGKLALMPETIEGRDEVRRIFEAIRRRGESEGDGR